MPRCQSCGSFVLQNTKLCPFCYEPLVAPPQRSRNPRSHPVSKGLTGRNQFHIPVRVKEERAYCNFCLRLIPDFNDGSGEQVCSDCQREIEEFDRSRKLSFQLLESEAEKIRYFATMIGHSLPHLSPEDLLYQRGYHTNEEGRVVQISLSHCHLSALPEEVLDFGAIMTLDLEYNDISHFPNNLDSLERLDWLYIPQNNLIEVPEHVGTLVNMKRLWLYNNSIVEVDPGLGELRDLRKLDLRNNMIAQLPDTIGQCQELWDLQLTNNRFTAIPEAVFQLTNLRKLALNYNPLTEVPDSIVELENLTQLSLFLSKVRKISPKILELENLRILDLQGCPLAHNQVVDKLRSKGVIVHR